MKKAAIIISFGTSHKDARESSLDVLCNELKNVDKGVKVYEAYTSTIIKRKLKDQGIEKYNVDEAVNAVLNEGADVLCALPTHMIPGYEYNKVLNTVEKYRSDFKEIRIAPAVLESEKDCKKIADIMEKILNVKSENEYILMGHGTDADANVRYEQMNEAFVEKGLKNVRIASVEAHPNIDDAICNIRSPKEVKKVIVQPFMVVAGDHAKNDMVGNDDSFVAKLCELGYNTEAVIKGLGEYSLFRKIYKDNYINILK